MAKTCAKCGNNNLEWVKDNGKWKMYDFEKGIMHNLECIFTPADASLLKKEPTMASKEASKYACQHGILLDRWCDKCQPYES